MTFDYDIVYENGSDKFNIEDCPIRVKVTVTPIQTARSYNRLESCVYLIIIYKVCEYPYIL